MDPKLGKVKQLRLGNTRKRLGCRVDAVRWDATRLPLRTGSVDVVITDLPFGKRSGSHVRNWVLYPRVLLELARVVRRGTGRACLLTMDRKCLHKTMGEMKNLWKHSNSLNWVNIGGLNAVVILLQRTLNAVSDDPVQNAKPTKKPKPQGKGLGKGEDKAGDQGLDKAEEKTQAE